MFGLRMDTAGPHLEGEEPPPMMHEHENLDAAIGAEKQANKAEQSAAEPVEQRAAAKGNADQQSTRRAQDRESVSQALGRVRQAARQRTRIARSVLVSLTLGVVFFFAFNPMSLTPACRDPDNLALSQNSRAWLKLLHDAPSV